MSCAKTIKPIEMHFEVLTLVDPKEPCIGGDPDSAWEEFFSWGAHMRRDLLSEFFTF